MMGFTNGTMISLGLVFTQLDGSINLTSLLQTDAPKTELPAEHPRPRLNSGESIIAVARGERHTLVLKTWGLETQILAAGNNACGQLGLEYTRTTYDTFQPVSAAPFTLFTQIAAGREHSLALATPKLGAPVLLACGNNSKGQLGLCDTNPRNTFTYVPLILAPHEFISRIGAGESYSVIEVSTPDGKKRYLGCGVISERIAID